MNTKWYISTLLIILAFIGFNKEQTKVANQQIVLQFTELEMTSATAHDEALAAITNKLEAFGIVNIEIIENDDTQLSIRYYSDIDARSVGEILSQNSELSVSYKDGLPVDFPKDQLPESFSIVVLDLQQQTDDGLGLNGILAFELNQDSQRFSNPVVFFGNGLIALEQDAIVQVAYKINKVIAFAINNTSNAIPEVRAGPYVFGNS
jgi:hypothetical protein